MPLVGLRRSLARRLGALASLPAQVGLGRRLGLLTLRRPRYGAGALAASNLPPLLLFRGPSTRTKMRHTQSLRKSEQRRRLFSGTFALSPMLAHGRRLAPPTTIVQTDCPAPQGRRNEKKPRAGGGASPESNASPWGGGRAADIARIATVGCRQSECRLNHLKLTRFRGHPNICVQGVHDGEDETTLPTGISSPDGRVGPRRPLAEGAGAGV